MQVSAIFLMEDSVVHMHNQNVKNVINIDFIFLVPVTPNIMSSLIKWSLSLLQTPA